MGKIAFTMQLNAGQKEAYRLRHDKIWPELTMELRRVGVSDYSIFLDERTHMLFGVLRLCSGHAFATLPESEIVQRWWAYMADIMETEADNSPVSRALEMMFHLD